MKHKFRSIITALFFFLFLISISCDDTTTESQTGVISVQVVDNDPNTTPVADVEITIAPINLVKRTDANGICNFEVEAGDYFVDAEVCCLGPGNIPYHEPVNVIENKTSKVTLQACLSCD